MYKKLTIKNLGILFVFLLIIVVLVIFIDQRRGKRTFRTELFDADTSKVTEIIIRPKSDTENPLQLLKSNSGWVLKSNKKEFEADPGMVNEILRTLKDMRASRIAATDKSKWRNFEVTDSSATRVTVKKGGKTVSTLYIGKFSYQMPKNTNPYSYYGQQAKISTYVRIGSKDNVYAVEGFLTMLFNRNINDYRNKVIIRSNRNDWKSLTFSYPADSSFKMIKDKDKWTIDGNIIDSAIADEYLSSITWFSSEDFVDDLKPLSSEPVLTLKIEGDNIVKPIIVKAFASDTTHQYLISSSMNEGTYFSGKKSGLTGRIFISKNKLLRTNLQVSAIKK
jgi:hypothetical protein